MIEFELILPRRSPKNPTPCISPGGDCGACVLSGLIGIPVKDIYRIIRENDNVSPFGLSDMHGAVWYLKSANKIQQMITDYPIWIEHFFRFPFGLQSQMMSLPWFNYIRMALEAGYYPICEVNMKGKVLEVHETDHWVLICGIRTKLGKKRGVGQCIDNEVLISDSARTMPDERWIEINDFLMNFGGFQNILIKPL